jgi:hypothetical protein
VLRNAQGLEKIMPHEYEPKFEQLQYIQVMLGELRKMAAAEHCDMLTYMIEMAYLECSDIVSGRRPPKIMPSINRVD